MSKLTDNIGKTVGAICRAPEAWADKVPNEELETQLEGVAVVQSRLAAAQIRLRARWTAIATANAIERGDDSVLH